MTLRRGRVGVRGKGEKGMKTREGEDSPNQFWKETNA